MRQIERLLPLRYYVGEMETMNRSNIAAMPRHGLRCATMQLMLPNSNKLFQFMRVKKTALIVCNNDKEYWITQKQFWNMVREGVVVQTGDRPLTGRFRGRDDQLLITVQHTVLNKATPIHTGEVLRITRLRKTKK